MKRARSELAAIVAGLVLLPSAAFAQDDDMMSFSEDEVEEQPAAEEEVPAEDSFDIMGQFKFSI